MWISFLHLFSTEITMVSIQVKVMLVSKYFAFIIRTMYFSLQKGELLDDIVYVYDIGQ